MAVGIIRVNADCCGSTEYDPASQGCCNGVVYSLASQGCCNGAIYDLATEECCGGQIVEKGKCCNEQPLPAGQECCKKVSPEQPYDPAEKCCEDAGLLSKTAIANLGDCPNRVPRQGYTPSVNGCGSDTSQWVPDSFLFIVSFTEACNTHDGCYGTCSTASGAKALCDAGLAGNMDQACADQIPSWALIIAPELLIACMDQATIYWAVLTLVGEWDDAQKEACQCCP